jgi:hypothetical protein
MLCQKTHLLAWSVRFETKLIAVYLCSTQHILLLICEERKTSIQSFFKRLQAIERIFHISYLILVNFTLILNEGVFFVKLFFE